MDSDFFIVNNYKIPRLIVGTGGLRDMFLLSKILAASKTSLTTVAMRRMSLDKKDNNINILDIIRQSNVNVLPNTAGCYTAHDAVLVAEMAREVCKTNLIKLEVIGDENTLYPDVVELLKAAKILVNKGFTVLPYTTDDPLIAVKLEQIGCAAIMPLGSPIGSGNGINNIKNLYMIRDMIKIPIIVDAGIGKASDATLAMEIGCDGVLIASAITRAKDPVSMASSMKYAVRSGRLAYLSGMINSSLYGVASSLTYHRYSK